MAAHESPPALDASGDPLFEVVMPQPDVAVAPKRRRVRFEEAAQVLHFVPGDFASTKRRKEDVVEEQIVNLDVDEGGCMPDLDPAVAATRRAQARQRARQMQVAEDTSLPDDVAAAEEPYDEPEELFNDMGIPMEPFNLRQERQEGYFDAAGNYVEYRLDNQDAWLDTLDEKDTRRDTLALAKRLAAAEQPALVEEAVPAVLDEDDVAIYRSRIAALLLPNETVLHALRRLGTKKTALQKATGRVRPTRRRMGSPPPPLRESQDGNAAAQGSAVELAAAMSAVPGEQPDVDMVDAASGRIPQPASGSAGGGMAGSTAGGAAALVPPLGGDALASAGRPSDRAQDAGPRPNADGADGKHDAVMQRGGPASGALGGRTVPPENISAFDRLTDLADLLLTVDFNIYSTTRENLLLKAVRTLGDMGMADIAVAAAAAAAAPAAAAGSNDAASTGAGAGAAGGAVAGPHSSADAQPDADMDDMFGEEPQAGIAAAPGTVATGAASSRAATADLLLTESGSLAASEAAASGLAAANGQPERTTGAGSTAPSGAGALAASDPLLSGYQPVEDGNGQMLYNSDVGYYYDRGTALFGDAATGLWYTLQDGQYEIVTAPAIHNA